MNPRIISGLRAGELNALGELFDAVGEGLFQHCWLMVRRREIALAVVRDTLIVAHAHIRRLRDPGQLRPWLYALARAECQRYTSAAPAAPEDAVPAVSAAGDSAAEDSAARDSAAGDEAQRMAWSAVMSLPSAEREMLDLTARRGMSASDAGLVTGLGADAASLITRARASLQQAMTAEIAVRRPGVAQGKVSPAKVYGRLPWPALPPGMRADILACFIDDWQAGYLVLAASRVPPLDSAGFPQSAERGLASPPKSASPVPEAAVAITAPDGLPVAITAPDGWPVPITVPDGLPVAGVAAADIDVGHWGAVSPPVRVTASRRIAVGMLAAAIAVGSALVLALEGLSLPGSTWSVPPVGSAVIAAGAPPGDVAPVSSGKKSTQPMVPFPGPTGRAQAAPGFRQGLGPRPGIRNAAVLYLAIARPPTTGGQGGQGGQPYGSQPGPVPSTTPVLPPPPVGSPVPSGSGSPSPSGSASPSPSPSTPSPSTPSPSVSPSASVSPPPSDSPSPSNSSEAPGSPTPSSSRPAWAPQPDDYRFIGPPRHNPKFRRYRTQCCGDFH